MGARVAADEWRTHDEVKGQVERTSTHRCTSRASGTFGPRFTWLAHVTALANLTERTWKASFTLRRDRILLEETNTHCPLCSIIHTLVSVWEHKREQFLLSCHAVLCSLGGRVFLQAPVTGDKQPLWTNMPHHLNGNFSVFHKPSLVRGMLPPTGGSWYWQINSSLLLRFKDVETEVHFWLREASHLGAPSSVLRN